MLRPLQFRRTQLIAAHPGALGIVARGIFREIRLDKMDWAETLKGSLERVESCNKS